MKQKAQLHWFKEGDVNNKYFHALLRSKRRKLFIQKVQNEDGEWVYGDEQIADAAIIHFQHIFTGVDIPINEDMLEYIPSMITKCQNDML